MAKIKVIINGAQGKMGQATIKAVLNEKDLELAGEVDINTPDLTSTIKNTKADVVIDFTHPSVAMKNIRTILNNKANGVIGTTGISEKDLKEIESLCKKNKVNCLVVPNFAIGAVLMMKFAKEAAHYMPEVEIIELHHDKKADAPSGTAIKTAQLIIKEHGSLKKPKKKEIETLKGSRGGELGGIRIHSVRLQGFVAHQEVIFGGLGQTLRIKHDTINRESFMPGVIMAIRKAKKIKGLVYGLENIL